MSTYNFGNYQFSEIKTSGRYGDYVIVTWIENNKQVRTTFAFLYSPFRLQKISGPAVPRKDWFAILGTIKRMKTDRNTGQLSL